MGTKTKEKSIFTKTEQVKYARETRDIQMRSQSIEVAVALRNNQPQGVDEVLRGADKVFAYIMTGKVPVDHVQSGEGNVLTLGGRVG